MKRLVTVLGIVLLAGVIAYPVFAHGPGWGKGGHMGYWGGFGRCSVYGTGLRGMTQEQQKALDDLDQKFYAENAELKENIWAKSTELDTILSGPDPDRDKAKALQKEINELQNKLAENRVEYEIEARKVIPDARDARGYGRGYGPGACWY
jgi:Spy/CpxP family protein refolding chaperone